MENIWTNLMLLLIGFCRGFDPKMKSNVDEANFHNIYRLEYRDTNQIKYFLDLYKIMKKKI